MNNNKQHHFLGQTPEENHLIHLVKSGDVNAFVKIYDLYVCEIYRYLFFVSSNNQTAEGITYKVFLTAWERIQQYRFQDTSFIVWLYSIAKNHILEYNHTHPDSLTRPNFSQSNPIEIKDAKTIKDLLRVLPPTEQQLIVLKYIVDMPDTHIAYLFNKRLEKIQKMQVMDLFAFIKAIGRTNLRTLPS